MTTTTKPATDTANRNSCNCAKGERCACAGTCACKACACGKRCGK